MQIQKQLQSEHRDVASSATRTTVERLLAGIREMAPAISARAAEIEAGRRMPLDLVEALKAIGVFRIFVPRSHGGLELDLPAALEIIEALGKIDGSVGWTAMISGGCDLYASLLSPESYEQVYRKGPDVIIAGSAQPAGTADATAGGWRVNGRWPFASGCQHADWIFGFCIMTEDGKPLAGEDGAPLVRGFLLPARRVAAGLRAARAFHRAQVASHWRHALAGTLKDEALLTQGTQAAIWVATACVGVADACFTLAGGSAIYESSPLRRRMRDLHVAAQHAAVQQRHYVSAGKQLLSGPAVASQPAGFEHRWGLARGGATSVHRATDRGRQRGANAAVARPIAELGVGSGFRESCDWPRRRE